MDSFQHYHIQKELALRQSSRVRMKTTYCGSVICDGGAARPYWMKFGKAAHCGTDCGNYVTYDGAAAKPRA